MDSQSLAQFLHAEAERFRTDMERHSSVGRMIAGRTRWIGKITLWLMLGTAVIVLYFIVDFAGDTRRMTASMVSMYQNFEEVSRDMRAMTGSVSHMGDNVKGMTTIAKEMELMSADMKTMDRQLAAMRDDMDGMTGNLDTITGGVSVMGGRMDQLSHTVRYMGYDVNQMSQPMRGLDSFGMFRPW